MSEKEKMMTVTIMHMDLYDSNDYTGVCLNLPEKNVLTKPSKNNEVKHEGILIWNRGLKDEGDYEPFYQRWIYKDDQMVSAEKWNAD